jgi:hypothetical protein
VRAYISAVTDLYREQKALGMNSHPTPREDNVREYIKSLQRRDAQREKEQFADKGRDTLLDGYSEDEFERVCHELWAQGGSSSSECHFRTLVDVLLGHYMLTRGGDRRSAEISDIFTFEFKGEGPTRCMPLIYTTRAGKQNQHGRLETAGALRNRNPLICMLSGLAFYLLSRWDLTDEAFPDLSQRSAWYDIKLLKGTARDPKAAFSYNSQRDWAAKAFKYASISSHKKTHIGRVSGAKIAELRGTGEDQIRRAGRWNQEQMVGCYLTCLPRKFMRIMAGHPPQMGCFEIPRAGVTPPDELLSMIWPELDAWKDRFGPGADQIDDIAALGLTNLLFYLREVILQDSVALRQLFPSSLVWNHPVFQHSAYTAFAQEVATCQQEKEHPSQLTLLYQAMPVLTDYLKTIDARNEQRIDSLRASIDSITQSQSLQSQQLQQLTSGNLTFRLEAPQLQLQQQLQLLPLLPPLPLPSLPSVSSSTYNSAQASIVATPLARSPSPSPQGPSRHSQAQAQAQQQQLERQLQEPPQHQMCRTVHTVEALWREWTVGLQGHLSIEALDRKWGSRWRAGRPPEQQWYSLRLEVIREIRRVAQAQRTGEEAAMWQVSLQQQQTGCSMDQLCKLLRAGRKARG